MSDQNRNLRHVIAQNWVPAIIAALGTVIAAVVAVVLTTTLNDDDSGNTVVQPPAATAQPGETEAGGAGETLSPAPDDTVAPEVPDNAITAAPWTFTYTVTFNDCDGGTPVGELASANLTFRESRPDDGYIEDLESAAVYAPDGTHIGDFVFHWPTWTFDTPIAGGGEATVTFGFTAPDTADSSREEMYTDGAGNSCRIVMQN